MKYALLKILVLYFCIIHPIISAPNPGITVPLQYQALYGIYTQNIQVGNNPSQELEAIVDTGSSALVLLGEQPYCLTCKRAITKGAITPNQLKGACKGKSMVFPYGSAHDVVNECVSSIQYTGDKSNQVTMKTFILKKSNQPSTIIGMFNHNLRKHLVQFEPFLTRITEKYTKYSDLTFVLCGNKGNSYYHVGPFVLPKPILSSKLLSGEFYTIATSGFYDANLKPIAIPHNPSPKAILDTGTGGFIILTPALYQPLQNYIYQNAGTKNQSLGQQFWKDNYCILQQEVDLSSFPTINIGFQGLSDHTPYYLKLSPTSYINQGGCAKGFVRLTINQGVPPNHPAAIRNNEARKEAKAHPDMVIGTPLLDQYAIQIHLTKDPSVSFAPNQSLCQLKQ